MYAKQLCSTAEMSRIPGQSRTKNQEPTMRFRPCIDIHKGKVKQIVGATLSDLPNAEPVTNFESAESPAYYAALYRRDGLEGGHVIMLGPGNEEAAARALQEYPGGLQVGGGVNPRNAGAWIDRGAQKVIVTSYVFREGTVCWDRLGELVKAVGKDKLVLDLSCRRRDNRYWIVTDRWQTFSDVTLGPESLNQLARQCSEFLVHAVDVEGKQQGIDEDLVRKLADQSPLVTTYAGGVRRLQDLERIDDLGQGRIDATAGSALDIFGGKTLRYADVVAFDHARKPNKTKVKEDDRCV